MAAQKDRAGSGKLLVFNGHDRPLEMQEREIPSLHQGEILIENLYTTLCGSDLHTYCGLRQEKTPTVLGHEIVGRILAFGPGHDQRDHSGKPLRPGDTVTWSIFACDHKSSLAKAGIPQKGDKLFKYGHARVEDQACFHGGLGEYCVLKPYTAVLKLPPQLPLPVAATLNCAIATVAGGLRLAGELKNKTVFITGAGLLGVVCAAMCRDAGAAWVGIADIHQPRLQEALRFGADEGYLTTDNELTTGKKIKAARELQDLHGGKGCDLVFDMSGSPDAMELGLQCLGIGGTAIWIGAVFHAKPVRVDAEWVIRRLIRIQGLHNYNYADFEYALDFLIRNIGKYPFETIVEKEFTLSQASEAFEYAIAHKPFRVGIKIKDR